MIGHDVELAEKLPDSEARTALLDLVYSDVQALRRYDLEARRDVPMLVVALIAAPLLGYLTIWVIRQDGWWVLPAAVFSGVATLLFVYGIFESAQRVPRDQKGRRGAEMTPTPQRSSNQP